MISSASSVRMAAGHPAHADVDMNRARTFQCGPLLKRKVEAEAARSASAVRQIGVDEWHARSHSDDMAPRGGSSRERLHTDRTICHGLTTVLLRIESRKPLVQISLGGIRL